MKNLIIVLSAACAVAAYYFGLRYFMAGILASHPRGSTSKAWRRTCFTPNSLLPGKLAPLPRQQPNKRPSRLSR